MRIIHDRGFETDKERCEYINQIHQNILVIVITIDHAMELLKIPYENVRLSEKLKMILSTSCNYDYIQCWRNRFNAEFDGNTLQNLQSYQQIVQMFIDRLPCKYVNVFKEFWNDSGVKYCLERRNEFNLIDSCGYYMNRIEELLKDNYVPLVQDILQVRIPTNGFYIILCIFLITLIYLFYSGISEYNFPIESINLKIVDVGGQKTERRKWIHCFESVTSIIYIAALSEFNQFLSEPVSFGETGSMPPLINKLEESKALFKTIVTSRWFRDSSVILFLNKFDIFEEKILSMQKNNDKRLEDYFPDYFQSKMMNSNEKRNDIVDLVAESILSMFYQQNPVYFRKRILYSHFTCATNTDNIKIVFQAVKDTIMQQILCKEMQIF